MSKIETGRFSDLFRRLLSMKGVTEVAAELSPEISPVFVVESERIEWEFLKGQRPIAAVMVVGPLAANPSTSRLRNPAGSGVLASFDGIVLSTDPLATTFSVFLNTQLVDLAAVAPLVPVARDTRIPALAKASALIQSGANVPGVGSNILNGRMPGDEPFYFPLKFVLTPGHSVDINTETVNQPHRVTAWWTERHIDALELS